ncbi:hypothetical protein NU10_08460 [Flavobacterium dauae]|uniref:hypothetical protein n=1 Tax=Flavobacterium dauae TaxID=1563479 RepID=UPI00101DF940|nr:hypothetical protein [Flavobacterium dauae]WLD22754.1 hypothetical protein NU10_08460 [Flavobacterium dauae]
MKKLLFTTIGIVSVSAFAQTNKTAEFTKKITYKIEASKDSPEEYDQSEYDKVTYDYYSSADNKEGLLSFYYNDSSMYSYGGESNFYVKNNQMIPLTISGVSKTINYSPASSFKIVNDQQTVTKLDRKGTFNGSTCQYYAVLSDPENKESYDFCFCIDENNKINNASTIFPDAKLKGLILSVEPNGNSYKLVYKSAENTKLTLSLDTEKMLTDIEEYQSTPPVEDYAIDEAVAAVDTVSAYNDYNSIYNDPLYTYNYDGSELQDYSLYSYISPIYSVTTTALYSTKEYGSEGTLSRDQVATFYKKESKSLVKNLKSAKMITADQKKELDQFFKAQNEKIKNFVPNQPVDYTETDVVEAWATTDTAAYAEPYDYYTKYQSDYKDIAVDKIELAYDIDVESNEQIKQYAPDYCDNLKSKIPNFQNKSLSTHVHNLTGQICDLYLYNNGGNVGYFETINSMRKSYLEIEKLRSSLSQKDQKLLLEFLKNLD